MTDYTKLVAALRYCEFGWSARTCDNCEYSKTDCQLLLSDAADAIEAQMLKQGEWVYNDGDYIPYCSICGMPQDTETPYCPYCGAKMEAQE